MNMRMQPISADTLLAMRAILAMIETFQAYETDEGKHGYLLGNAYGTPLINDLLWARMHFYPVQSPSSRGLPIEFIARLLADEVGETSCTLEVELGTIAVKREHQNIAGFKMIPTLKPFIESMEKGEPIQADVLQVQPLLSTLFLGHEGMGAMDTGKSRPPMGFLRVDFLDSTHTPMIAMKNPHYQKFSGSFPTEHHLISNPFRSIPERITKCFTETMERYFDAVRNDVVSWDANVPSWEIRRGYIREILRELCERYEQPWVDAEMLRSIQAEKKWEGNMREAEAILLLEDEDEYSIQDIKAENNLLKLRIERVVMIGRRKTKSEGRPPTIRYEQGQILTGKKTILIPREAGMSVDVCKILLDLSKEKPITEWQCSWDEVYERIQSPEHELGTDEKKNAKKSIDNTIRAINERFQKADMEAFLEWSAGTIRRRY